jgi:two-component sensor histidine kinase/tetratricopeptide (TPR) repeat protein
MFRWLFLIIILFIIRFPAIAQDTTYIDQLLKQSHYLFAKNNRSLKELDSALTLAKIADSLSVNYLSGKGESYLMYSRICRAKRALDKGKTYTHKAIDIFTQNNRPFQLGEAYVELCLYYSLYGEELAERIRCLQQAEGAFIKAGNKKRQADCLKELGDLHQIQGNLPQALAELKQALQLYQAVGCTDLMGIYDLLGYVSTALGDQQEGIRYGILAVQIAEQSADSTTMLCTIYNRLGITYTSLNEFNKAYFYFYKALSLAEKLHDYNAISEIATNITTVLEPAKALTFLQDIVRKYPFTDLDSRIRVTVVFVNIHEQLKQYKLAESYCIKLLIMTGTHVLNDEQRALIYNAVIRLSLSTHNYTRAAQFLATNDTLATHTGIKMNAAINHLNWFRLDSAQGLYASAITHYQQYKTLNDQLFNESKSRQISQLEILYDIENKDRDIKLKGQNIALLTKQSQLQQAQLHQGSVMRTITLISIALLLIIVSLFFNRYRLKKTQEAEINLKNISLQKLVDEKDWLLKEIHHRVKNNLHMVVGLLDTQSAYLKSEEAMLAITDSQHRVQAMSLIHQKLYQSENLSSINMNAYIYELTEYLKDCFNTGRRIRLDLQIDNIVLPLSHSVPLGLILNEAITNAMKYAFPDNKEGIITISLQRTYGKEYALIIKDDGIGFNQLKKDSLGMILMEGLSGDIEGTFSIENDHGTRVTIIYPYE